MTYFGFLAMFVVLPAVLLAVWHAVVHRPPHVTLRGRHPLRVIGALVVIAFVYTTPWDNYLVATRVWWYDESLVLKDWVIGWVPLEEYCFFILQTVFSGLLTWLLAQWLPTSPLQPTKRSGFNNAITLVVAVFWALCFVPLIVGYRPATYLCLILTWALPPVMLQLWFGADTLWRCRWLVLTSIGTATGWLAFADALAISSGTWTIDPEQSFHQVLIGGVLPLEEFIFFFMTNVLVVFGLVLGIASESPSRVPAAWLPKVSRILGPTPKYASTASPAG